MDDSSGTPRDIRNDFTEVAFATPRAVQDVTGIDKSAMERLLLLADFSVDFTGVFNPAANFSHTVFRTVPSTSVARTVTMTVAAATLNNECLFTDYNVKRGSGGELTYTAPGVLSDGAVPTWS